jgi:rhamnose transport system permease protein
MHNDLKNLSTPLAPALSTPAGPPRAAWRNALSNITWTWEHMLVVMLGLALLMGRLLSDAFLGTDNLGNLLAAISEIALMALGMTLLVVAAEIDLSVASILGLCSGLMGLMWQAGLPMPLTLALVLLTGIVAGAFNGWLVTGLRLPSLAVTIGTMALFRGITFILLGDTAVASFPEHYTAFGINLLDGSFLPLVFVWLLLPLAVVFMLLLQFTGFGRKVYAIGANEMAVRFSGINVGRSKFLLFVLSGAMSALAGIVYTLRFSSARADNGTGFELGVVAAVLFGGVSIFGGRGTVVGVLLALLIMAVLNNALTLSDVSNEIVTIVTGLLLLSSVLVPNLMERWKQLRRRPPR